VGPVEGDKEHGYTVPLRIGNGPMARTVSVRLELLCDPNQDRPTRLPAYSSRWLFKSKIYNVLNDECVPDAEIIARIIGQASK
jgi:hypothetical protein